MKIRIEKYQKSAYVTAMNEDGKIVDQYEMPNSV